MAEAFQDFINRELPRIKNLYNLPEERYRYKDEVNVPPMDNTFFKRYPDLETACQQADHTPDKTPLAVHEHLVEPAKALTKAMEELSTEFDKQRTSIYVRESIPSKPHKSTMTKITFTRPHTAPNFPDLHPAYDQLTRDLNAMNLINHTIGTRLITQGQRIHLFQLRLERVNQLLQALIHTFGPIHATYFRKRHSNSRSLPQGPNPKPPHELAIRAVRYLINKFDRELLQYLDINRTTLNDYFCSQHPNPNPQGTPLYDLSPLDKATYYHIIRCMRGYIKTFTCIPYHKKLQADLNKTALEGTAAFIERKQAREATEATSKAIKQASGRYPQTPKLLEDTIINTLEKHQKAKTRKENNHRKRSPTPTPTSDTNSRPPKQHKPNPKQRGGPSPPSTNTNRGTPRNRNATTPVRPPKTKQNRSKKTRRSGRGRKQD